eukprot:403355604
MSQAQEWAEKKKQQLEKAKLIKEERKAASQIRQSIKSQANEGGSAGSGGFSMRPQSNHQQNRLGSALQQKQNTSSYSNLPQNNGRQGINSQQQFQSDYNKNNGYEIQGHKPQIRQTVGGGIGSSNFSKISGNVNTNIDFGYLNHQSQSNMNQDSYRKVMQQQQPQDNARPLQSKVSQQKPMQNYYQEEQKVQSRITTKPPAMTSNSNFNRPSSGIPQQKMQSNNTVSKRPQSGVKRPELGYASQMIRNDEFNDGFQDQQQPRKQIQQKKVVSKPPARMPPSMAFQQPKDMNLNECKSCGRSFNDEAYAKHSRICKKVFQTKRKVFNSQAKRIISNEQKQLLVRAKKTAPSTQNNRAGAQGNMGLGAGPAPKWKNQSEQFRMAMRAARGAPTQQSYGGGSGYGNARAGVGRSGNAGNGGYQQQVDQYDDRKPCPYCGRRFNDTAADRHIPHCKTKSLEINKRMGPQNSNRGGMSRGTLRR